MIQYLLYQICLHHMHALVPVNTPIRGWNVYQTGSEYQMLMVEENLVKMVMSCLMMLMAMLTDHRLTGQLLLKAVEIF